MVFIDFLTFFIALAVLVKGADILVSSAAELANHLGISDMVEAYLSDQNITEKSWLSNFRKSYRL